MPHLLPRSYGMYVDLHAALQTEASIGRPQGLEWTAVILGQEWLWPLLPLSVAHHPAADHLAGDIAALQWGPSNMMVSVPAPGPSFGVSLATGPHYFAVNDVLAFTFTATWSSGSQRTIDQNGDSWVWIRRMEGEYAAPGGGGGPT